MSEIKTWESSENKWFDTGYKWTEVDFQEIALIENIPVSPIGGVGKTTIEPKKLGSDGSNFKSSNDGENGEVLPGTDGESSTNDYGGAQTDEDLQEDKE